MRSPKELSNPDTVLCNHLQVFYICDGQNALSVATHFANALDIDGALIGRALQARVDRYVEKNVNFCGCIVICAKLERKSNCAAIESEILQNLNMRCTLPFADSNMRSRGENPLGRQIDVSVGDMMSH
jgi:hypothetical protein